MIYLAANTGLAIWDTRVLKAKGVPAPSTVLAAVLIPVYLFKRQSLLGRNKLVPGIWIGAFLLSLILSGPVVNFAANHSGQQLDMSKVTSSITDKMNSTVGGGVSVQCPSSEPVQSGLTFKCLATDSSDGSSVMVDVTVQDSNGDIVWQTEG